MASNAEKMERVVTRLIELIEKNGRLPWHRPWKSTELSAARSAVTGKAYGGVNHWVLGAAGEAIAPDEPNVWATYRQVKAEGGQVRKGERAMPAVLWKPIERINADGDEETFLLLRVFNVFHWTQADWADGEPREVRRAREIEPVTFEAVDVHDAAERVLTGWFADGGPTLRSRGERAYYDPRDDTVVLPPREAFDGTDGFYRTAFHEAIHSTGHRDRLNRDGVVEATAFGSERYSREELVAEMGAAILADQVGLDSAGEGGHDGPGLVNSAAYLQGWLRKLRDDPMALSYAATRAGKAAELVTAGVPARVAT